MTTERTNPTVDSLAKIDQWMQRLADETDQAAQSAELTRYLTTLARFYTYSAHNCALIAMQRPDATRVAGYRAWQALGRQVVKGAKGITILCPAPIKGKTAQGDDVVIALRFRTGYVFDLADTQGDDLPVLTVHAVEGDRYDTLLRQLIEIAERGGLRVAFKPRLIQDANGVSYGDGRIELKEGNPAGNLCKTLIHEMCHERMHRAEERPTRTNSCDDDPDEHATPDRHQHATPDRHQHATPDRHQHATPDRHQHATSDRARSTPHRHAAPDEHPTPHRNRHQ